MTLPEEVRRPADFARYLREQLAARLGEDGLPWLGDDDPLADHGIDSVDAITILAAAQRSFGVLVPADFVVGPETSLASLAELLAQAPDEPSTS